VDLVLEVRHVVGDLALAGLAAASLVQEGGVAQQVGHSVEVGLLADRELERRHADAELVAEVVEGALERSPLPVELVRVDHPWPAGSASHTVPRCRCAGRRARASYGLRALTPAARVPWNGPLASTSPL